jgi:hypothetical protein
MAIPPNVMTSLADMLGKLLGRVNVLTRVTQEYAAHGPSIPEGQPVCAEVRKAASACTESGI